MWRPSRSRRSGPIGTLKQFNLNPIAVGIDAGYFTAPVAECLERRSILGVFGYRRPSRTKNVFKKKHFIYQEECDSYRCPYGQELIYKTTSRSGYREYHSDPKICIDCPLRKDCTSSQNRKKVTLLSKTAFILSRSISLSSLRLSPFRK